jgi:glycerate 2-kinase
MSMKAYRSEKRGASAMAKQRIRAIFDKAVVAVDPSKAVSAQKDDILASVKDNKIRRIFAVSLGKAAVTMARALVDSFGEAISAGIIVTKYEHTGDAKFPGSIKIFEAGHPVPDENGVKATREVVNFLKEADAETLVVYLISGGGSALLVCPSDGITLQEKQHVTGLLLRAGATIQELNAVRKHISSVKGGRLAEATYPAKILSLILSDVIGDPLDVIASGPTAPDTSTYSDVLNVINKYKLMAKLPTSVIDRLVKGAQGLIPETPKQGAPIFQGVRNVIVGSNTLAVNAAKIAAEASGYHATIISTELSGEASCVAKELARKAIETQSKMKKGEKVCLIAGGETTVTVRGDGKGGRNTEMALAFGIEIKGASGITFLSAGTDGQDGPTDAAGAITDGNMFDDAVSMGLDPLQYLKRNDSYHFFKKSNGLVITGPTGTNVMDVQIILIEKNRHLGLKTQENLKCGIMAI